MLHFHEVSFAQQGIAVLGLKKKSMKATASDRAERTFCFSDFPLGGF